MNRRARTAGVGRGQPSRNGPRAAALAVVAVAALGGGPAAPAAAQTILNVERLQPGDVQDWHWGVEGDVSLSRGNTEYEDVHGGLVLGRRGDTDWLRMFVGVAYRSETGEDLESDRYVHLRWNHWWTERWQSFHFVQYQASRQNLLQERVLVGSGLRRRLLDGRTTLDVGSGVMREREDLDPARVTGAHPVDARVWRMANLVVATRQLREDLRLLGVAYVQPDLSTFDDLRLLTDLSLVIGLTEAVDLTIRTEWRRDSRPPEGRKRDDVVFRTGFTVSFR